MLAQSNEYLKDTVSGVIELSEDEQIRQCCQARADYELRERRRLARHQRALDEKDSTIAEKEATITKQAATITEQAAIIAELEAKLAAFNKK